jgi:hypothetical protein
MYGTKRDRLCGLVVVVPGYRSRGPGFDSRRYQIFWEVVGLERGLLSLASTTELLERKRNGTGLETREYGRRDPLCCPRNTLYSQTLALTSPKSGDRSVRMVRSRTKAKEFVWLWDHALHGSSLCLLFRRSQVLTSVRRKFMLTDIVPGFQSRKCRDNTPN